MAKTKSPVYQEWDVQIKTSKDENGKTQYSFEKLKISRPAVKISEEEAAILNEGVLKGGNNYAKMYFPANTTEIEDDTDFVSDEPEELPAKPTKGGKGKK